MGGLCDNIVNDGFLYKKYNSADRIYITSILDGA